VNSNNNLQKNGSVERKIGDMDDHNYVDNFNNNKSSKGRA
jgi:hypothetical protein